jgi:Ca2+-binding EF-hand superfamily protein
MSGLSGVGLGGFTPSAIKQFQQNLFNLIDLNGDGSVSKTELEQAVGKAGGSATGADALYSVLDPNNSGGFSEQQFAQVLPGSGLSDQTQSQLIGYQAQGWPGASSTPPGGQLAQNLFAQIDGNGDGAITQSELEQAVTKAGGSKAAADALYAKLDPNGTGSVSEQQFIDTLQPPSPSGNTAQDALLALLDQVTQSAPGSPANPQAASDGSATGNSAQDALLALINASGGSSSSTSGASTPSKSDLARAFSLYQSQLEQQLLSRIGANQGAGVA